MQEALNFSTKTYACTFRVRKFGAIGWAYDAHTETVKADDPKAAWGVAIVTINEAKVWDIMHPMKIVEVTV